MPSIDVEGQEIFYRRHDSVPGGTDCVPLVLVHGAGGLSMNWPPQLRRLRDRTVYALDLPGHGVSGGRGLSTVAGYRSCVAAFAETLGLSHFVLAGHSMGGAVALELALAEPERLAGLILMGSSARLPVADQILDGLEHRYVETVTWLVNVLFGANADPRLKEAFRAYLIGLDPALLLGDFLACNGFDLSEQVGDIRMPTLIICGAADKMTPAQASEYLYDHLPDSALSLIENAGHMVMLEEPHEVAGKVAAFMDSVDQNRSRDQFDTKTL